MDTYEYGKHMRRARRRANLSPTDVALKIGIRPESVCHMEMGYNFPKLKTALAITSLLGVTLDEWLGIEPKRWIWDEREGSIAEHAEYVRTARYMPRSELAELSGVTSASIRNLESGKHPPRLWTILCLAKALDMTPSEFIGDPPPARRRRGR